MAAPIDPRPANRLRWVALAMLIAVAVLAGCNPLSLIPKEVDRRPALPAREPLPIAVEDVIPRLEVVGFSCEYSPDSDIPGGWNCRRGNQNAGNWMDVGITSDETGPIEIVHSYMAMEGEPAELDAAAAQAFSEFVLEPILPEDARPPVEALHAVVADNFQMGVGNGYYLVFHRNSLSRTMLIQYSSQD